MLSINEINLLKAQNEGLRKQNKNLQKQVYIINRVYELCNEPADNIAVVNFQERVKAIIDGKAQ